MIYLGFSGKSGSEPTTVSPDLIKTFFLWLPVISIATEHGRRDAEERWLGVAQYLQNYVVGLLLTLFFSIPTGRYLLPNPVAGQAWPASAETSNLVRMRSQALGQSAPSLTASLVSVLHVAGVAMAIISVGSV